MGSCDVAEDCRILVTGAGGFVAGWLLKALARDMPSAVVTCAYHRGSPSEQPKGTRAISLDITESAAVREAISFVQPTGVVHLAGVSTVAAARRDRRCAWAVNVGGTLNLAEAVLEIVPSARFVFASSAEVYGGTFAKHMGPVHEEEPLDPVNAYAATKAAADLLLGEMARDGLNTVRLRPFNHSGPGQGEAFVVPSFAAQIARIEAGLAPPVLRTGNLEVSRDFLDVRDVVDGYIKALSVPDIPPGRIYNLASGEPLSIRRIVEQLVDAARMSISVETDPQLVRPVDIPTTVGSFQRAQEELAWRRAINFESTISDVLDDCRARFKSDQQIRPAPM